MRVALVTYEYPPSITGGAGTYAFHLTRELQGLGHEVKVFAPSTYGPSWNYRPDSSTIPLRLPKEETRILRTLRFWLALPKAIRREEKEGMFEIVHFNGVSYWFIPGKVSQQAPHVLTIHHVVRGLLGNQPRNPLERLRGLGDETGYLVPSLESRCVRICDAIIAVSNFTKDEILRHYHIGAERIHVVYNGVSPGFPSPEAIALKSAREAMGLPGRPLVLFVGRLDDPRKRLEFLLEAFSKCCERTDATLLVIGDGDVSRLRVTAVRLGVEKNVEFMRHVDDATLRMAYAACDVFVNPAEVEGFGLAMLEAMAAGKPVVGVRAGATQELVVDGQNGLLVDPSDVDGLSEGILEFMNDREFATKVGRANAARASSTYSWSTAAKRMEDIYYSLLANPLAG